MLLSAYSHTSPTHISLEIYSPLYLTVAPRIQIDPICHLSGLRDSKAKSAEVWNGWILTVIKQFRLSELFHPLKIRTPATSYPLAEKLMNNNYHPQFCTEDLVVCDSSQLVRTQTIPPQVEICRMPVTSSSRRDRTSHWPACRAISRGAGTTDPQCLCLLCTCADRCNCCWSVSELYTFKKSPSERQNLLHIHLSQFARHTKRRARSNANWLESRWTL